MASPTTTLHEEQQLIASLLALMQQEQQLLIGADGDGLAALTPEKSRMVGQLASLASCRHQALGRAGFAASEAGMEAWLGSGQEPAALPVWQEILELTRQAKELNRINGMLINKQMSHNRTILNAMRSPANGAEPAVYGPSGQTSALGPSRRFVVG